MQRDKEMKKNRERLRDMKIRIIKSYICLREVKTWQGQLKNKSTIQYFQ